MKKLRKLKNSNEGVVGIIVAFLLTGLIVVVISTIQTVYVPKWMEQAEADHMEMVADQFSQLKFAIDTQSAIKQKDTPISTSITLGNRDMPFLSSNKAYGSLEILSNECTITIDDDEKIPLNITKYTCNNNYYLDQSYIFEAGAVIISQIEGDIMNIKPAFYVSNEDEVIISFTIINIQPIGDKRSIGGYGTYPIQTEYSSSNPSTVKNIDDVNSIKISTNYPNSWQNFLSKTLTNSVLDKDFDINVNENEVEVIFLSNYPNVNIEVVDISAQIAPGWIENIKGG
jgi:hypothetical protein